MNIEYENFIGIYKDVYPEGYCEHLIKCFETFNENGFTYNRQTADRVEKHEKEDVALDFNQYHHEITLSRQFRYMNEPFNINNELICPVDVFFKGLQNCFVLYVNKYSILKNMNLKAVHMKVQKTLPGEGYHLWHAEKEDVNSSSRILVYALYLNTLKENSAGETEFLYQKMRIPPQKNTMIIWPSQFTHVHRGNVVHGDESKYIVTGWVHVV